MKQFIPFGEFLPDQGEHNNPGLVDSGGFCPVNGAWTPQSPIVQLSADAEPPSALMDGAMGAFCSAEGNYQYQVFVGTNDDIIEVGEAGAGTTYPGATPWAINSRRAWAMTTTATGVHFAQYGTNVIAVNGLTAANYPQIQTARKAAFVKMITGPAAHAATYQEYLAKFVTVIDNRVLLGNVQISGGTAYPQRVHWSYTDDPRSFSDATTTPASLSDYQDLYDEHGTIQGLCGGTDYALVFKQRCLYRMSPHSAFQYSFEAVPASFGTQYSHSIVRVGRDVYFWGPSGPCKYDGLQNVVTPLGLGKVSRSLLDPSWIANGLTNMRPTASEPYLAAAADTYHGLVGWNIPVNSTTASYLLLYNYLENRFSWLPYPLVGNELTVTALFNRPDVSSTYATPRDFLFVAEYVAGVASAETRLVYGWTSGNDGYGAATTFKTGYYELAPNAVKIDRVRPILTLNNGESTLPSITASVYSRQTPWHAGATVTTSATLSANGDRMGRITLPNCPYRCFHQFELSFAQTDRDHIAEIEGIEVEFTPGPER